MLNDLDLIIKEFPRNLNFLNVYAIGDVHVGAEQFDEKAIKKTIDIISKDPNAAVCLCGDLGDFGLKNSKTNVYKATMQPQEQMDYIYELFKPIASKMAAVVPGNHEERLVREVGTCPLYDLCVRWGVSDVYRENVAITKFKFGVRASDPNRAMSFIGLTTHGSTRNKHKRFISCFDGIDFSISGHTHTPEYSPHGKIRVNSIRETADIFQYKEIVVDSYLSPGGYSFKKEYEVTPSPELQYLELSIKRISQGAERKRIKSMNYHAIQI